METFGSHNGVVRDFYKMDKEKFAYLILSDIEGHQKNLENLIGRVKEKFQPGSKGYGWFLDAVFVAGDIYENFDLRGPYSLFSKKNQDYVKQGFDSLKFIADELDCDVYVIPGGHETRKDYEAIFSEINRANLNIYDLNKEVLNIFDDRISVVGFGGYHIRNLTAGYLLDSDDYLFLKDTLKDLDSKKSSKVSIVISHGPPLTNTNFDSLINPMSGEIYHVGDENLHTLFSNSRNFVMNFHGHLHEKSLIRYCEEGNFLSLNISSVTSFNRVEGRSALGCGLFFTLDESSGIISYGAVK